MMYVRFPLSLRNVEDLLHERGVDIRHETVRIWWNRFGPLFARELKKRRFKQLRQVTGVALARRRSHCRGLLHLKSTHRVDFSAFGRPAPKL